MREPAVLLAAGPGTRLRPLTDKTPKCLLPVGGRPMLDWWLELLTRHRIARALLATNHLADQVKEYSRTQPFPVALDVVDEPELLGTAGAVRAQVDWLGDAPDFWVIYVDNLSSANLTAMREFHRSRQSLGTLAVYVTPVPHECGIVQTDSEMRIIRFVEKPKQDIGNLANGGLYLLSRRILGFIPDTTPVDFARDVFPRVVDSSPAAGALHAWRIDGYHLDMGTWETYRRAERDVAEGRFP